MALFAGPWEYGKTTSALALLAERSPTPNSQHYFNWDNDFDRNTLLELKFPPKKFM